MGQPTIEQNAKTAAKIERIAAQLTKAIKQVNYLYLNQEVVTYQEGLAMLDEYRALQAGIRMLADELSRVEDLMAPEDDPFIEVGGAAAENVEDREIDWSDAVPDTPPPKLEP